MNKLTGMQIQFRGGPFAKLITSLLLIVVVVISLFFGAIIIAMLIGLGAILFLVLYLRARWVRHKLGLDTHPRHSRRSQDPGITIEGEYTVEREKQNSRGRQQDR